MSNALENAATLRALSTEADPGETGMWPDVTATTKILRVRDRVFLAGGAEFTGNFSGTQGGFVPTGPDGAAWGARDSRLFVASDKGLIQVSGFVSNENMDTAGGQPTESIAVAGYAIGNKASRNAWALYGDLQFEQGTYGYGIELALKNKTGTSYNPDAYTAQYVMCGIWMPAGGDPSYGGSPTANCDVGIAFGGVDATGRQWNRGIVFFKDSLEGTDGVTGTGVAIEMAKGHELKWRNSGGEGLTIRGNNASGAADILIESTNNNLTVAGTGAAEILIMRHTASAVNHARLTNSTTGNLLTLEAQGDDTNVGWQFRTKGTQAFRFQSQGSATNDEFRVGGVNSAPVNFLHAYGGNSGSGAAFIAAQGTDSDLDVQFIPKGTNGRVRFGAFTSSGDVAITGSVEIRDAAGNLRKLAVIA